MSKLEAVLGSGWGDEGKGLVSRWRAFQARQADKNARILTVFFNGGFQRAHTTIEDIYHCLAAGSAFGSDTYYQEHFIIDPIALWLEASANRLFQQKKIKLFASPECRIVSPFDVWNNRRKELSRGGARHGSCGMGIFETAYRNRSYPKYRLQAKDLSNPWTLWEQLRTIEEHYAACEEVDEVYTLGNFMKAVDWFCRNVQLISEYELYKNYDVVIYEGGQGLLLDQSNEEFFPYLTPSSTGLTNFIWQLITGNFEKIDIFYVSRTYMTRHGAGPFPSECRREEINPDIKDSTNIPNEWQNDLRFGWYDKALIDKNIYRNEPYNLRERSTITFNMVYTHANYTHGQVAIGRNSLISPYEAAPEHTKNNIYLSFDKYTVEKMEE